MLESLEPVLEVLDEYGNPDRASFPYSESKPAREDRSFPPRGIPDVPHVTLQLIDFPNENRGVCVTMIHPLGSGDGGSSLAPARAQGERCSCRTAPGTGGGRAAAGGECGQERLGLAHSASSPSPRAGSARALPTCCSVKQERVFSLGLCK